jgi:hypothetical protein
LRYNNSSQFFVNRAKYIDCDYCDINYIVRCYILLKGTRKLANNFKNSISTPNRFINREKTLLGLFVKTPEQSKSRSLYTKSRETFIFFDNDRESSSQDRSQSSPTDIGNNGSIMAAPKSILFFSGTLSISYFIGTDVINFFINYEDMYEDYNIKKKKRIYRCPRYCAEYITIIIKGLASFLEPD